MTQPVDIATVRHIFKSGKSLGRSFLNARIQSLALTPPVLDLGAGEAGTSSYHNIIPNFHTLDVVSVDMVADKNPTHVANIEAGIPCEDNTFQTCIAFNFLEHIYDHDTVMAEAYRTLAADGIFYIYVPFLMRVHGDPYDFFRYTATTLERKLTTHGFTDVMVEPLGGGAFTAALSQVDFAVPRQLRGVAFRIALWIDGRVTRRSGGKYRNANDYPLGYFVTARKGQA